MSRKEEYEIELTFLSAYYIDDCVTDVYRNSETWILLRAKPGQ